MILLSIALVGVLLAFLRCLYPRYTRQVARHCRGTPLQGGACPTRTNHLVIEQSCPVWDKGSSYQNKILGPEVNLPFNPLAEGLDLFSLSVLLWTCKV